MERLTRGLALAILLAVGVVCPVTAAPREVTFSQSAKSIDAYDFVEVTMSVTTPDAANPFTDVSVEGSVEKAGGKALAVDGFCDSADGTTYRIRFMPMGPGDYTYRVTFRQGSFERTHAGTFRAVEGHRKGLLRVDPQHRWHFLWEGTGEHYFWNGTTTYWLMGWDDDAVIRGIIDRLAGLKVSRLRALLAGRAISFWGEPIVPCCGFRMNLNPWVAARPDDPTNPGFDFTRFNVAYWQKYERMLHYARERDMIISVIFDINDSWAHPADSSEDERRYFRYTVARLGAFSNITWDLGNEFDGYHKDPTAWANAMGAHLKQWDVYNHLASAHPMNNKYTFRDSPWFDMTLAQYWPRPLHAWMLNQRQAQEATGRIIPQVNEEYGYEDHYPIWSPSFPDGASADANRRAAWEMSMAGGYQTTGETAKRGTNVWPNTGGGWVNGRGDASMVMLQGYAHMVDFFTSFDWWKADPHDELVGGQNMCLAEPGRAYAIYLPMAGKTTVKLEPGLYEARWFNPRTGKWIPIPERVSAESWTTPEPADSGDWAILMKAIK